MPALDENRFIQSLSVLDRARLFPCCRAVHLPVRHELYRASEHQTSAYFILSGLASMVTTTSVGETVEVGLIGREGLAGGWHLLGPGPVNMDCFMQVGGSAFQISMPDLQAAFADTPGIRASVLAYAQFQFTTLAQLKLCQGLHEVKQRLARWLLMAEDRTGSHVLEMTQEALAIMLGTQRATLTVLLGDLEDDGSIERRRGSIAIRDRMQLSSTACECYAVSKVMLDKLYGGHTSR